MERFTQRARHVLNLAQEEAERLQHDYIGSEHLLLGLMREEEGVAAQVLKNLGVDFDKLNPLIVELSPAKPIQANTIRDLTPSVKKTLETAVDQARRLGHHYIGTEHLLLGLVRQSDGVAIEVLKRLNLTPEAIRHATRRALQSAHTPPESAESPSTVPSQPTSPPNRPHSEMVALLQQATFKILSMIEGGQLTVEQAQQLLQAMYPPILPDAAERAYIRTISMQLGQLEGHHLHLTITDKASGAVQLDVRIPLKALAENLTSLVWNIYDSQTGQIFVDDSDPQNRIEARIEKD